MGAVPVTPRGLAPLSPAEVIEMRDRLALRVGRGRSTGDAEDRQLADALIREGWVTNDPTPSV